MYLSIHGSLSDQRLTDGAEGKNTGFKKESESETMLNKGSVSQMKQEKKKQHRLEKTARQVHELNNEL